MLKKTASHGVRFPDGEKAFQYFGPKDIGYLFYQNPPISAYLTDFFCKFFKILTRKEVYVCVG